MIAMAQATLLWSISCALHGDVEKLSSGGEMSKRREKDHTPRELPLPDPFDIALILP